MERSIKKRLARIQEFLGLSPDGILGPGTLTAIERELFGEEAANEAPSAHSLTLSRRGLAQLIRHEITSKAYYQKNLSHPVYPGGHSGVTIGIGYDLGYNSAGQIRKDWQREIDQIGLEKLVVAAGLRGDAARDVVGSLKHIEIPYKAAGRVFFQKTLPRFAALTLKAYPGCDELQPDAQVGLLSLVYNRGIRMTGGSRQEMKAIKALVVNKDYPGIAEQITAMKRLWADQNLGGLLKRRDDEASLVCLAQRHYEDSELVRV